MYSSVAELGDGADVIDHEDLHQVGDVEEGQDEGDGHLHDPHQGSHPQVGDGAKQDPPENTREGDTGKKLAHSDDQTVNVRFYLVRQKL